MSLRDLYNRRATVQRTTETASSFGASGTETTANVEVALPCRVEPLTAEDRQAYMKETGEVTHLMYCEYGTDIKVRDEVIIDGDTYLVDSPPMDAGGQKHHYEVLLKQREES